MTMFVMFIFVCNAFKTLQNMLKAEICVAIRTKCGASTHAIPGTIYSQIRIRTLQLTIVNHAMANHEMHILK